MDTCMHLAFLKTLKISEIVYFKFFLMTTWYSIVAILDNLLLFFLMVSFVYKQKEKSLFIYSFYTDAVIFRVNYQVGSTGSKGNLYKKIFIMKCFICRKVYKHTS